MGLFGFLADVYSDSDSIKLRDDGVFFRVAALPIGWEDVISIEGDDVDCTLTFKGGLEVQCFSVGVPLEWDDDTNWEDLGRCKRPTVLQVNANNPAEVLAAAEDVLWAHWLANKIRDAESVCVNDATLLWMSVQMSLILQGMCKSLLGKNEEKGQEKLFKEVSEAKDRIGECIEAMFALPATEYGEPLADADGKTLADALTCLPDGELEGVALQKKHYEEGCKAIQLGADAKPVLRRKDVLDLLLETDGKARKLGDAAWKSERKTIICSEEPMVLSAFSKRKRLKEIMVMDAADIEAYNEEVPAELKLVFPAGHPQNGCTYIQHPLQPNLYFEVNEFHDSLLERKQNELLRILESLGAYSARVEVRHERREDTNREAELQRDGKGSYGVSKGAAAFSGSESRQTLSAFSQSATKDWTFNPPEKPALPDNLVFYPTEETWKNLAASVLRGGLKRATVDLEYKSEYGITEKRLSDISASAKVVLPSFEMHLKSSFSSNLHRLTTTQWHYEAIFENEGGKRAGDFAPVVEANAKAISEGGLAPVAALPLPLNSSTPTPLSVGDAGKVEALFRKRAKRYAQSEGHIDAAQRADLEAFAQKYGIDEFRMEELIEEAFE